MAQILQKLRKLDPLIHLILLTAMAFLGYKYFSLSTNFQNLQLQIFKKGVADHNAAAVPTPTPTATPTQISIPEPKTIIQQIITPQKQVTFVPLGSTTEISSSSWTTLDDTQISLDLILDYSQNAQVSWEASLKTADPGGEVTARLWDDTNKIAVNNSEIKVTGNTDFIHQSTGDLYPWAGRNIYKVQLKSLIEGYKVTYSGGKMKIRY